MKTAEQRLLDLAAEDVMQIAPLTIPRRVPLRDAAALLRRAGVSEAPVVDERGRCVGILSAADFLPWAEEGFPGAAAGPARACPYQTAGRLLTGEEAVICTLAEGACPLQAMRPTSGGRHTAVCLQPSGVLCDWQQVTEGPPEGGVAGRYAKTPVTAGPNTPVAELVALMADAGLCRIFVLDDQDRPVGVVCATDVLAALAWEVDVPR